MTKGQIRELGWQSWTDLTLELTATVTDGHRQTYTDVTMVELKRTNIKLDVVYRPQVIKPGMTYQSYVSTCRYRRYRARKPPGSRILSQTLARTDTYTQ